MSLAATVNGVDLDRRLTKVQKRKAQRAIANWANDDGEVVESQEVIMCSAKEWPQMLKAKKSLASWSVLAFGPNVVAISPPKIV
jgi:hypothetical protein